ncbi:hypothetical protein [Mesorhizobium sp. M0058]|uniref:hypothetical protein n=1 Tax=Mesorhizobium sp. M0058 TaxID=2956865 RepID=UPI003337A624
MTAKAHYASLIESIFGPGTANFDTSDPASNNVIGALAHQQFQNFRDNFAARLHRLHAAVQTNPSLSVEILSAVNRIATSEWDGAYAELSALDYFLAAQATGLGNVELDRTIPAAETLASDMGMQNANHDLAFNKLGVSMDTKLLSDKIGDILEGIFKEFKSSKGIARLVIIPSYEMGSDFTEYAINRKKLLAELTAGVDITVRPKVFYSKVIPGLSYTFAWNAGVHFGESTYSPINHAKSHHPLLFGHAKKFSRVEPTIITFVVFPWSGEKALSLPGREPEFFFRRFADHFFNDYVGSPDLASKYNPKFKTSISAGDATTHLSGIIFLRDNLILSTVPAQINIEATFAWNPNALHPLAGHPFDTALRAQGARDLNQEPVQSPNSGAADRGRS